MQKVIVQIDWYTKIILILIAVLLAGILAKPYIVSRPAGAYGDHVTVDNPRYNPVLVEIVDSVDVRGDVDAYITGTKLALIVVDWKEREDYLKKRLEQLKRSD